MKMFQHALVADGSATCRRLFRLFLRPIAIHSDGAADLDEAARALNSDTAYDLLLIDMDLPGGGARALLDRIQQIEGPHPYAIVLSRDGDAASETDVTLAGAAAFLKKPISFGMLTRAAWKVGRPEAAQNPTLNRREYRSPVAATILDEQLLSLLECEVRNLSPTGALLVTAGPIDRGAEFHLRLRSGDQSCDLQARVARIQEPAWGQIPGVGVEFVDHDRDAVERLIGAIEG